jgi:osmoprotectant transport system permease protein
MLSISEVWQWLFDVTNWEGRYGLVNLFFEHMTLSFSAILIAALIAVPIGVAIGHLGKGEAVVVAISSISRAIPTMGLLFALVMLMGIEFRDFAVTLALAIIAIPPILAGSYAGIKTIPQIISQAAKAQGMTAQQLIWHVELPLSAASIIGGVRIAYIQVVSTVVLAPLIGLGGLGFGIIQGLALRDFAQVTASAVIIVFITILGDRLIGFAQKLTAVKLAAVEIDR